jgi:hypothetical protein
MCFDDSVVRFTDFGTFLRRDPSDKSLGYYHAIRFADSLLFPNNLHPLAFAEPRTPMLSSPSLKTFQFLSVKASH